MDYPVEFAKFIKFIHRLIREEPKWKSDAKAMSAEPPQTVFRTKAEEDYANRVMRDFREHDR